MYKHQIPAEMLTRSAAVGVNAPGRGGKALADVRRHASRDRNNPNRGRFEMDRQARQEARRMTPWPSKRGPQTDDTSLAKGW